MAKTYFQKDTKPEGWKIAPGAVGINPYNYNGTQMFQGYSQYVDSSGQLYNTMVDNQGRTVPASEAGWAINSDLTQYVPIGGTPAPTVDGVPGRATTQQLGGMMNQGNGWVPWNGGTSANPTPNQPVNSTYQGNSIVDFLGSQGKPSDYNSRANLAKQYGITNYTGSASQNTQLLNVLRGKITAPTMTSFSSPYQAPTPSGNVTLPTPTSYDALSSFQNSVIGDLQNKRTTLENTYNTQIIDLKNKEADLQTTISNAEGKLSDIQLSNWKSELQKTETQRLQVETNFFANQKSVSELEQIMTASNQQILDAQKVTGLSSMRTPIIAAMKADAVARVGVIQAVMAARNNQISVAETLINNTLAAVSADKKDQIDYYSMIYDTSNKGLISLKSDEKKYIEAKIGMLENDLTNAQKSADMIKEAMTNPKTAQFLEDAGVKVTDSSEQIQSKLAEQARIENTRKLINDMAEKGYGQLIEQQANLRPAGTYQTMLDSSGKTLYFDKPKEVPGGTDPLKKADYAIADQLLREAPTTATYEQHLNAILQNTRLTSTEINAYLASKGIIKGTSEVTQNVPASVVGNIKALISKNVPLQDINNFVNFSGYSTSSPEIAPLLKDYSPSTFKWFNPLTWF